MPYCYRLQSDVDHFKWLTASDPSVLDRLGAVRKEPVAKDWPPTKLEAIEEDEADRRLPLSDFPNFRWTVRCFSLRAAHILQDMLAPNGEFILAMAPGDGYVLYHALHECDAFDPQGSDVDQIPRGGMIIRSIALRRDKIDSDIFRIPESVVDLFVSDRFKSRVEETGLTGFEFLPTIDS